jgi:WhiB family transcriptional regulator, redox-sensing transcriptional regulator
VTTSLSPTTAAIARPFASFQLRAEVRLFHTNHELACREDPDMFFDPRQKRTAISQCDDCPFRGRCGYNAVAMGATHGIWGGLMLPGDYPQRLKPIYVRLAEQFEQRREIELGGVAVAPLPDPDTDDKRGSRAECHPPTLADAGADQALRLGFGRGHARPAVASPQWPLNSRIA